MPTIFWHGLYRAFFYSHEPNEPPHVHVERDGAEAKFWLEPEIALARNRGFRANELGSSLAAVRAHRTECLEAWHEHFGSSGSR